MRNDGSDTEMSYPPLGAMLAQSRETSPIMGHSRNFLVPGQSATASLSDDSMIEHESEVDLNISEDDEDVPVDSKVAFIPRKKFHGTSSPTASSYSANALSQNNNTISSGGIPPPPPPPPPPLHQSNLTPPLPSKSGSHTHHSDSNSLYMKRTPPQRTSTERKRYHVGRGSASSTSSSGRKTHGTSHTFTPTPPPSSSRKTSHKTPKSAPHALSQASCSRLRSKSLDKRPVPISRSYSAPLPPAARSERANSDFQKSYSHDLGARSEISETFAFPARKRSISTHSGDGSRGVEGLLEEIAAQANEQGEKNKRRIESRKKKAEEERKKERERQVRKEAILRGRAIQEQNSSNSKDSLESVVEVNPVKKRSTSSGTNMSYSMERFLSSTPLIDGTENEDPGQNQSAGAAAFHEKMSKLKKDAPFGVMINTSDPRYNDTDFMPDGSSPTSSCLSDFGEKPKDGLENEEEPTLRAEVNLPTVEDVQLVAHNVLKARSHEQDEIEEELMVDFEDSLSDGSIWDDEPKELLTDGELPIANGDDRFQSPPADIKRKVLINVDNSFETSNSYQTSYTSAEKMNKSNAALDYSLSVHGPSVDNHSVNSPLVGEKVRHHTDEGSNSSSKPRTIYPPTQAPTGTGKHKSSSRKNSKKSQHSFKSKNSSHRERSMSSSSQNSNTPSKNVNRRIRPGKPPKKSSRSNNNSSSNSQHSHQQHPSPGNSSNKSLSIFVDDFDYDKNENHSQSSPHQIPSIRRMTAESTNSIASRASSRRGIPPLPQQQDHTVYPAPYNGIPPPHQHPPPSHHVPGNNGQYPMSNYPPGIPYPSSMPFGQPPPHNDKYFSNPTPSQPQFQYRMPHPPPPYYEYGSLPPNMPPPTNNQILINNQGMSPYPPHLQYPNQQQLYHIEDHSHSMEEEVDPLLPREVDLHRGGERHSSLRRRGHIISAVDSVFSSVRSASTADIEADMNDSEEYLVAGIFGRAFPERFFALLITLIIEIPVLLMISGGADQLCTLVGKRRYFLLMGFLPLSSAISGNCGLQGSTLTTRAVSHLHVTKSSYIGWLFTEIGTSFFLGISMGAVLGFLGYLIAGNDVGFGLTICCAQFLSVLISGLTGTLAPLIFTFIFHRDSGKWGGPMETAIQDIVGSFAMVVLAYKMLVLFGTGEIELGDEC